jgi:hypothetical protein
LTSRYKEQKNCLNLKKILTFNLKEVMVEDKVTAKVAMALEVMAKAPTVVVNNSSNNLTATATAPKAATDSTQRRERNLKAAPLVAATTMTELSS